MVGKGSSNQQQEGILPYTEATIDSMLRIPMPPALIRRPQQIQKLPDNSQTNVEGESGELSRQFRSLWRTKAKMA